MLPSGRSLQRTAAAPDFFAYPRIVLAVTGEPAVSEHDAGVLLKDRLYIGYVEKTAMLEVISYNEAAGRFEFQLVKNYRAGARPQVVYASRAICISCHQNHAPIFPRAIWGETTANGLVANRLAPMLARFGLVPQANVDFPDDIDKAVVRANTLAGLQAAWRMGCAAPDRLQSRRCRKAALAAVLQYGLSGEHDFDSHAPGFRHDLVPTLRASWQQHWAQGLSIAQSSLPDRNPFGAASASYGAASGADEPVDWTTAAHVPAHLDPLNLRLAREVWRFGGPNDAYRLVSGWTRFFAVDDFRFLDSQLRGRWHDPAARRTVYRARCTALGGTQGDAWRLRCADSSGGHPVNLQGRIDATGKGRIDWVNLGPDGQARDVELRAPDRRSAGQVLQGVARKNEGTARLPDGRALAGVEIRLLTEDDSTAADVEIAVIDDFALVREALDRLSATQPTLFDDAPLGRTRLLPALFSELGMRDRAWCCTDDGGLLPPRMEQAPITQAAFEVRDWQPLFRYCGTCHLGAEAFPPNFLSGDAGRVAANLRQCAPRMLVRLSAWRTPEPQRVKSPMPPPTALRALGSTAQQWREGEALQELRAYVAALVRQEGRSAEITELVKDGYEALPKCLGEP
jgi:hypothetical protein